MMDLDKSDELFENVELETPSSVDTRVKDRVVEDVGVSVTDPGWNDHVMSLFEEDEMFDGRPLCAGLRRVAELVLGPVASSRPTQVFPPANGDAIGRATVVWEVVFQSGQVFSDVADCWEGNTDDAFCVFNTATAATRAEGRALRKALRLKTVAAEEMTTKNTASIARASSKPVESTEGEYDNASRMTDAQANFVDVKAKQLNIDVVSFFKEVFNLSVNRKIDKSQASAAIKKLNEFQQNRGDVPASIIGYNENWRD